MDGTSNSIDSKLVKPTINPRPILGPKKEVQDQNRYSKCYEIEYLKNCFSGGLCGQWASCLTIVLINLTPVNIYFESELCDCSFKMSIVTLEMF